MTPKQIKTLKTKIEIHKQTLYSIKNLEVDLIYGAITTFVKMDLSEQMITIWCSGIEDELEAIINAIEKIEKDREEILRD